MCNTTKNNYSVQDTSTPTHLTSLNSALIISSGKLHTTDKLPPDGKEYLCFQINGKSSHAAQCVKSRIMNKSINIILFIYTHEKQYVVIRCMLQSPRLEYYMKTIGIDQSLNSRPSVEHKFLNNIKKIHQHAGKCDEQQNLKYILDAAMVYTPGGVTDVIPSLCITQTTVKKPISRKSLCLFTNIFDVKIKLLPVVLNLKNQNS